MVRITRLACSWAGFHEPSGAIPGCLCGYPTAVPRSSAMLYRPIYLHTYPISGHDGAWGPARGKGMSIYFSI